MGALAAATLTGATWVAEPVPSATDVAARVRAALPRGRLVLTCDPPPIGGTDLAIHAHRRVNGQRVRILTATCTVDELATGRRLTARVGPAYRPQVLVAVLVACALAVVAAGIWLTSRDPGQGTPTFALILLVGAVAAVAATPVIQVAAYRRILAVLEAACGVPVRTVDP